MTAALGFAAIAIATAALGGAPAPAPPTSAADEPTPVRWIEQAKPVRGMWELGTFAGAFITARPHDFYDPSLGYRRLRRPGPEAGLRAAYYPLAMLGVEGEFAAIWTVAKYGGQPAFLYGLRLHAIAQLPMYRITPFILGGYGLGGIRSNRDALGNDLDPIGHYGGGVKFFATPRLALRIEGRHLIGPAAKQRRVVANHGEVLFGISLTFGRGSRWTPEAATRTPRPSPSPSKRRASGRRR